MAIDINTLPGVVGNAESAAGDAVNGLDGNSTMADVIQAQLKMTQYQLVASAVSAIINADGETKKQGARNIRVG
ncbi:MAG TPA: hypothetical protein VFS47_01620 [Steroidobacteraceae bacterium]|nr:hypothetical protein [Steroidobacteraceae bacterium]